ncbi:MAG: P-type conjugative transfer protein TrbJ [Hyphomonadaceae bacterium]
MNDRHFLSILRLLGAALATFSAAPAHAQLTVIDPSNLIQNAWTAARALEQINNQVMQITNQIRQLENDALNLTRLGNTFAPEIMAQLRAMDALISEARGLALQVGDTRAALERLYSGDYRNTDAAERAHAAVQQIDAARAALQTSLILQAQATEQMRDDQAVLQSLSAASSSAPGTLAAIQSTNELLTFQAEQSMRLQALLVAQSRAEALEQAREMEARAQAQAERAHFFSDAASAHPGAKPWP